MKINVIYRKKMKEKKIPPRSGKYPFFQKIRLCGGPWVFIIIPAPYQGGQGRSRKLRSRSRKPYAIIPPPPPSSINLFHLGIGP
jgi:hypothetical protein